MGIPEEAYGGFMGMPYLVVEDGYVKLSPMDQQKALHDQYKEAFALHSKVRWQ